MDLGSPVKHLLVDLDGTLLGNRSVPLSIEFITQAMTTLKKYTGWRKAARVLLEMNLEFAKSSRNITNDLRVLEIFAKRLDITVEEGRQLIRASLFVIFPALEKHFYPMPGAREFLDWAKERYPLTLATNPVWPVEIIELRVKWAGIDPKIFQNITHVRQMRACKPSLEYYEQILEHGQLAAADCLLIGNDVKMDLPATGAGIRVFIVDGKSAKGKKTKSPVALKTARAKAKGWKGSFAMLQSALEEPASNP